MNGTRLSYQKSSNCLKERIKKEVLSKKEKINFLFEKLNVLERGASDLSVNEIIKIKNSIKKYYEEERVGIEKRACESKRNFIKQPSKILIERERTNANNNFIKTYITSENIKTQNNQIIINDLYDFYNNLMGIDKLDS